MRNWWERRWRFKVNERVLGHQGLLPEKVKIEEQSILSGLESEFWGQHLALGDLLCVSKSHLYDLRLRGLTSLSDIPKVAESAVCAAPGKLPTTSGTVTARRWLCKNMDHTPDLCPDSVWETLSLHPKAGCVLGVSTCYVYGSTSLGKGLNCCRSGKWAGIPGLKLLLPLANTFSVHRPDYIPLSTKARQNLTVNSLRKWIP